jgi:hypothetical protein
MHADNPAADAPVFHIFLDEIDRAAGLRGKSLDSIKSTATL